MLLCSYPRRVCVPVMRGEVGVLGSQDLGARGPSGVVTAGPWIARDSFIAETAVTIDRLTAKIERLERREEALKAQVAELTEHAQQASRLQSLAESLKNSRDFKLDEMVRLIKDVRGRVETLEGPRAEYHGLTHKSLVAIDRKLAELSSLEIRDAGLISRLKMAGMVAVVSLSAVVASVAAFAL